MPALVRPRLNDFYDLPFTQEQVNFAIPLLDDDIPLYVDPFLLWKSPSQQDRSLHRTIVNAFDAICRSGVNGDEAAAIQYLINISECEEVGLGHAKAKSGRRVGVETAQKIIALYRDVPQIARDGIRHLEALQLMIEGISRDRLSDIACSLLKSFLVDFTLDACERFRIPAQRVALQNVLDDRTGKLSTEEYSLPINPGSGKPVLLVPKRWLRRSPWISFEGFKTFGEDQVQGEDAAAWRATHGRDHILNFNRANYGMVLQYLEQRERTADDCRNDPLFTPIPLVSARRKLGEIQKLPSGKDQQADKKYEDAIVQLLASMLYPQLDFAKEQSRTDSGALVRDLVFYNNRTLDVLQDIATTYDARQLVFELKNVAKIEREHINQLNRYLGGPFGRFGVLVTRKPLPRAMVQHTIDLWSGQRKCLLALTDADVQLMVDVFESKQRLPIEVLKRAFVEFIRKCPS